MGPIAPSNSTPSPGSDSVKSPTELEQKSDVERAKTDKRTLVRLRRQLELVASLSEVCARTLIDQAADYDNEIGIILRDGVGDILDEVVMDINSLIGEDTP